MKTLLRTLSFLGLALTAVPAVLTFYEVMTRPASFAAMNIGMVLWFSTAVFWIGRERTSDE